MDYQTRLEEIQARLVDGLTKQSNAVALLSIIGVVFVVLAIYAVARRGLPNWSPLACLPPAISIALRYGRRGSELNRLQRQQKSHEQALRRLRHQWQGTGNSGEEWKPREHLFARDLNLFGNGSVFELLCTVRTQIGGRRLAEYLTLMPTVDETKLRQGALTELRDNTALREKVVLLGTYENQQASWDTFSGWLGEPSAGFYRGSRWLAAFLAATMAALPLVVLFGLVSTGIQSVAFFSLLLVEGGLAFCLRKRVQRIIAATQVVGIEVGLVREGLGLLRDQRFNCKKLQRIQAQLGSDAPERLKSLERLVRVLSERNKEWFYFPSMLLLVGTQTAMAIDSWKSANAESLKEWLDAWGEFEALSALACYAYERQETTTFPEFTEAAPLFDAKAIGHPLLSTETCVRNDFHLGPSSMFCVISGSNMAGKSTLLRAIGSNTVFARAGAPVTADRLMLSSFNVCASISIVDSLGDGKSKFLKEVERLRDGITATKEARPVLFLIDEMLGGTNSRDRRLSSEAVVRTLVDGGALGVLSTHDLALTELPSSIGAGAVNVHMASRRGGGPLDFDYLLKPGVTSETNALAIAEMAGVLAVQ